MIKIENTRVWGFPGAVKGMRNALNSHAKSDSDYVPVKPKTFISELNDIQIDFKDNGELETKQYMLGKADKDLMKRLIKAGGEHRKFMRFIHIQSEWTLPLKLWKQVDTYHWLEKLSDSTMHTGVKTPLTADNIEKASSYGLSDTLDKSQIAKLFKYEHAIINDRVEFMNEIRELYHQEEDKEIKAFLFDLWTNMLPDGTFQHRNIDMNYETALNILKQRSNHKLRAWRVICAWIKTLPWMSELVSEDSDD